MLPASGRRSAAAVCGGPTCREYPFGCPRSQCARVASRAPGSGTGLCGCARPSSQRTAIRDRCELGRAQRRLLPPTVGSGPAWFAMRCGARARGRGGRVAAQPETGCDVASVWGVSAVPMASRRRAQQRWTVSPVGQQVRGRMAYGRVCGDRRASLSTGRTKGPRSGCPSAADVAETGERQVHRRSRVHCCHHGRPRPAEPVRPAARAGTRIIPATGRTIPPEVHTCR